MAGGGVVPARGAGVRWRVSLALALVLASLLTALGPPASVAAATITV